MYVSDIIYTVSISTVIIPYEYTKCEYGEYIYNIH